MILLEGLSFLNLKILEDMAMASNENAYISCGIIGQTFEKDIKEKDKRFILDDLESRLSLVEHTVMFFENNNIAAKKLKKYLLKSKYNLKIIDVAKYSLEGLVKEIEEECLYMK